MEKKTIGAFIAVLRKANGMTQKDLADKLFISDKAVSRWERDECAPDLSLIPVIAETFGVSCDELLRGERIFVSSETSGAAPDTRRTDKQVRQMLASSLQKFQSRALISLGLTIAASVAMMVCTYGFARSILGYGLTLCFIAASMIFLFIHASRAISAAGEEEYSGERTEAYRRSVLRYALAAVFANIAAAICLAPIVFNRGEYGGYRILSFDSWLLTLPLGILASVLVFLVLYLLIKGKAIGNALYGYAEKEKHNHRLLTKTVFRFGAASAVILTSMLIFISVNPMSYAQRTEFDSVDSFIADVGQEKGEPVSYRFYSGLFSSHDYYFTITGESNYKEYIESVRNWPAAVKFKEKGVSVPAEEMSEVEQIDINLDVDGKKAVLKNFSYALIDVAGAETGRPLYAVSWESLDRAMTLYGIITLALLFLCVAVPSAGAVFYLRKREK